MGQGISSDHLAFGYRNGIYTNGGVHELSFFDHLLSHKTGLNSGIVGFAVGLGALAGTLEDLSAAICRTAMGAIRC